MSTLLLLVPDILAGNITVTEATRVHKLTLPDASDFFCELFQAMLDHWRAQAPEMPIDSPLVYALFRETSDQRGTSELVGVYRTAAGAEVSGELITTSRVFVRKMILDMRYIANERMNDNRSISKGVPGYQRRDAL